MFDGQAEGRLHPLALVPPNSRYLPNFQWFDYVRPVSKEDIFNWRPKKPGTELTPSVKHDNPKKKKGTAIKKPSTPALTPVAPPVAPLLPDTIPSDSIPAGTIPPDTVPADTIPIDTIPPDSIINIK